MTVPPITRTALALYAGASGDHNPMHIDADVARAHGMPDVFAQGMLVMGYLGRLLTDTFPLSAIAEFGVRFVAITRVHQALTCTATVSEITPDGALRLDLRATDADGTTTVMGFARITAVQPTGP
ncbi:MaoC/PaaZ C-terminal domain-containing protein [Vulcanimicrobium alpinum]|nr:MaoC/PaaZ C-terminal domain-containing protein [Vulcanimicrobium alpinum]